MKGIEHNLKQSPRGRASATSLPDLGVRREIPHRSPKPRLELVAVVLLVLSGLGGGTFSLLLGSFLLLGRLLGLRLCCLLGDEPRSVPLGRELFQSAPQARLLRLRRGYHCWLLTVCLAVSIGSALGGRFLGVSLAGTFHGT